MEEKFELPFVKFRIIKYSDKNNSKYGIQYLEFDLYRKWINLYEYPDDSRRDLTRRPVLFNTEEEASIKVKELEEFCNQGMSTIEEDYQVTIIDKNPLKIK